MSRFAFVSSNSGWGGSEELWGDAAKRLATAGHAVTVFLSNVEPDHPRLRGLQALGCRVYDLHRGCLPSRLPLPRTLVRAAKSLIRKNAAQRVIVPMLRTHLAKLAPDLVVISQGSNFDGIAYTDLCRSARRPYVVITQKAADWYWPTDSERAVMRAGLQSARRCYFVSQHNLQLTESQIGETLTNAEVVRNPFLVSGTELAWPASADGTVRLACVARLNAADKGQDILLQILTRDRWRDRDVTVSLFGRGPNEEALRALAARLAVSRVEFCGFANDVEAIWKKHHAVILPSRAEGLPLALVEAMMCGRFGIVTNEGGSAEVVEDGRTGFIASAAKADEVERAMERAWAVRNEWESIGKAAGAAIRTLVPPDPAGAFTAKLLQLVDAPAPYPETEYAYSHRRSQ